ncbi:MAG: hypothetical protein Q9212_004573 [Teloschistes hypoglaucus]
MEVLQNHVNSAEGSSQATNWKFTPHKHVAHRLKGIPKLSSAIFSRQAPLKAEPVTSYSSDSTSKTGTEPRSAISTPNTSVLCPSQVFTIQKLHVSPSMPVDEKIQAVWTLSIKGRLSAVLLHDIPTGTCVQELMMAGKWHVNLRPTIVVSCNDAATKRKVEKTFKGQCWLQDLLKTHHMMFVALVAETFFSAGPVFSGDDSVTLHESYAVEQPPVWHTTSCGLSLLTRSDENGHFQQGSTLGGLLAINGTIVGLTAGHPFDRMSRECAAERSLQGDPGAGDESDETSSMISSEAFIFNGDEDDDADGDNRKSDSIMTTPLENAFEFGDSDDQTPYPPAEASTLREPLGWHPPRGTVLPISRLGNNGWDDGHQNDHDWALLLELPLAVRSKPNKVAYDNPRHDIPITGTVLGPAAGEVIIATAGISPQSGQLHSAPATMKVNAFVLNVQLITLQRALPRGISGAWVLLKGDLCGYVVAIRQDLPWAYMVAIEPVLEDIKRTLKTGDVRLPTAAEIEIAAKVHSNQSYPLWLSEMDEQSLLKGNDWPSASTMQKSDGLEGRPGLKLTTELKGGAEFPSHEKVKDVPKAPEGNLMKDLPERPNQLGPAELGSDENSILSELPGISALAERRCRWPQEAKDSRQRRQGFVKPEQAHRERSSFQAVAEGPVELFTSTPSSTLFPPTSCSPDGITELSPSPRERDKDKKIPSLPEYPSGRSEYIPLRDVEKISPELQRFANDPSEDKVFISLSAMSKIWWGFEASLLRLEYRRYKHWRRHLFAGIPIFRGSILSPRPRHIQLKLRVALNGHPTLCKALSSFVTILYLILYAICIFPFFPLILWVWSRYGDVLAPDPPESRRFRAIMMLGMLPDQYGDAELTRERERLRQQGSPFGGSAV